MKTIVPGTCGEWIQGYFDGEPVLVSCPVELYSTATISMAKDGLTEIYPGSCQKALQAVLNCQMQVGMDHGYKISLDSPMPVSRGYGSSTADIVSASAAIHFFNGIIPTTSFLASLACEIEPSDGTMFPGWNLFPYRSARWNHYLGEASRFPLLILDQGNDIDTISYNQELDIEAVKMLESGTKEAIELFRKGIRNHDIRLLGMAASMSALNYQKIFHSELVEQAADWTSVLSASGMIRAHSGSIIGLLFKTDELLHKAKDWLGRQFLGEIIETHTTGGGVRYGS